MTGADKMPPADTLTDLIRHLPIPVRVKARRRIEAIAAHWALVLQVRYGAKARAQCIRRLTYCANHAPGLRWHVWCRVFHRLR
jgi:hypothetical protein